MALLALIAKIGADITGYERAMHKIKEVTHEATSEIKGKIGAIFTVAAVEETIRRTVEYAARIKDLSEQFRMSTDQVQQLDIASKKVGLTFEDWERVIAKGINPFGASARQIEEALADAGPRAYKLQAAFEALRNQGPLKLISSDEIKALDDADKKLQELGRRLKVFSAGIFTPLARLTSSDSMERNAGMARILGTIVPGSMGAKFQYYADKFEGMLPKGDEATSGFSRGGPFMDPIAFMFPQLWFDKLHKPKKDREPPQQGPNLLADDLASIGGFGGRADFALRSILQQQLSVQMKIEQNTKMDVDV